MTTQKEMDVIFQTKTADEIKKEVMKVANVSKDLALHRKSAFLIDAVIDCMVELRDKKDLKVSVEVYNQNITLERLIYLSTHNTLPMVYIFKAKSYLRGLPGFNDDKNHFDQLNAVKTQHSRIENNIRIDL